MLCRKGFSNYSAPVRAVMKSVRGRISGTSLTGILTANYSTPVRPKALPVKGLSLALQKLQKINSISAFELLEGLWD